MGLLGAIRELGSPTRDIHPDSIVTLGVDIGQRVDPTAICVAECQSRTDSRGTVSYHHVIRYLDRLPLGTPYPEVAKRVSSIARAVEQRTTRRPDVFLDVTGVGAGVCDIMRSDGMSVNVIGCYFTHGDRRTVSKIGYCQEVHIGKGWLVGRLQVLLQDVRVHLPRTREAAALKDELLDYEIRINENANLQAGAFKVGKHDDMVTALGLATQEDRSKVGVWLLGGSLAEEAREMDWNETRTYMANLRNDVARDRW